MRFIKYVNKVLLKQCVLYGIIKYTINYVNADLFTDQRGGSERSPASLFCADPAKPDLQLDQ